MELPNEAVAVAPRPTYRMFVKDLVLACSIGVYAHERGRRQRVRVNVDLDVHDSGPSRGDTVSSVVSYENIVVDVRSLIAEGHINLIETLAERIAEKCLRNPQVVAARVRVEKLDVFTEAASVGIEIERTARVGYPLRILQGGGQSRDS